MSSNPTISIILGIGDQRARAQRALEQLLKQENIEQAEIILLDLSAHKFPPLSNAGSSHVKIIPIEQGVSLKSAHIRGIKIARGKFIAMTEEHAVVAQGWLKALLNGFSQGHTGVGLEPRSLNPNSGISNLTMVINFSLFLPIDGPHITYSLPSYNSAYKKDTLLSFGDELIHLLGSEYLLQKELVARGHSLLLSNESSFSHLNEEFPMDIIIGHYYWHRTFGAARAGHYKWGWIRKLTQVFISPLVPLIRLLKLAHLQSHMPENLLILLRFSWLYLVAQTSAAAGMAMGCVFGEGGADYGFTFYEVHNPRSATQS